MSKVPLTVNGAELLRNELHRLKTVERPSVINAISEARAQGDLSENAEYHDAREELNFIDGRIEELEDILSRSKVVKAATSKNTVGIGCQVTVAANGSSHIFYIVGEWEANPLQKKISHDSPLGKALLGKKVGDKVEVEAPAGKILYTVKKIH